MASTSQITVSAASPTAVTVNSYASVVRITENRGVANWPTTDFLIRNPLSSSTPVRIQAGAQYIFQIPLSNWAPGKIIGYVQAVTGTTTMDQDENNP